MYLQKIGEYEVSLLFGALHPNEPVTLTFQFQAKKGEKLKLHAERGEVEALYIVDETRENFYMQSLLIQRGNYNTVLHFPLKERTKYGEISI